MPLLLLLQTWKPKTASESGPVLEKGRKGTAKVPLLAAERENKQAFSSVQTNKPRDQKTKVSPAAVPKALGCSEGMLGRGCNGTCGEHCHVGI